MPTDQPAPPKQRLRWFHLTPGRLLIVLLVVEGFLLLSKRFNWFTFNGHKGWTVLIAVAAVGLFLLLMLLWFIASLIFRWHFQFSIRSLLVLTIAVAIPFSWLAMEMKWAREQKEAKEAIKKMGGGVYYDYKYNESAHPSALRRMREQLGDDFFLNVRELFFFSIKVSDVGMEHIKGLTQLQILDLANTEVSDVGMEHIKGLVKIQELYLGNTEVSDVGMEHLKGLTQLKILNLSETKISDVGLEHLKGLTQLRMLYLSNTKVSDVGLEHLKGLTQLVEVGFINTQVTDAGVARLQKALPNCIFRLRQPSPPWKRN